MERASDGERVARQAPHCLHHEVDGTTFSERLRCRAAAAGRPAAKDQQHSQVVGPVEAIDLSRRAVADDGRRSIDRDRQPIGGGLLHQLLSLVLRLFVGVAKALARVELVFGDHAHPIARHVAGGEVVEALQLLAVAPQLEDVARAVDVHLLRDLPRHPQVARSRRGGRSASPLCTAAGTRRPQPQVHVDDVAGEQLDRSAPQLSTYPSASR